MKNIIVLFLCLIFVSLVYSRTVGQALDSGIAHAKHDVKEVGRVITSPVRYVGEKASHAVSATRHAAGGVVGGAGNSLRRAGSRISGN